MRQKGLDEAPAMRQRMYEDTVACRWIDHYWWSFISIAIGEEYPVMVLCERCGRTPWEALLELRIPRQEDT